MKKEVIKCDRCGKDISPDKILYGCKSHIELELNYCHYGSIGGNEDIDKYELDLCDECSRDLSMFIKNEFIKRKKKQ